MGLLEWLLQVLGLRSAPPALPAPPPEAAPEPVAAPSPVTAPAVREVPFQQALHKLQQPLREGPLAPSEAAHILALVQQLDEGLLDRLREALEQLVPRTLRSLQELEARERDIEARLAQRTAAREEWADTPAALEQVEVAVRGLRAALEASQTRRAGVMLQLELAVRVLERLEALFAERQQQRQEAADRLQRFEDLARELARDRQIILEQQGQLRATEGMIGDTLGAISPELAGLIQQATEVQLDALLHAEEVMGTLTGEQLDDLLKVREIGGRAEDVLSDLELPLLHAPSLSRQELEVAAQSLRAAIQRRFPEEIRVTTPSAERAADLTETVPHLELAPGYVYRLGDWCLLRRSLEIVVWHRYTDVRAMFRSTGNGWWVFSPREGEVFTVFPLSRAGQQEMRHAAYAFRIPAHDWAVREPEANAWTFLWCGARFTRTAAGLVVRLPAGAEESVLFFPASEPRILQGRSPDRFVLAFTMWGRELLGP